MTKTGPEVINQTGIPCYDSVQVIVGKQIRLLDSIIESGLAIGEIGTVLAEMRRRRKVLTEVKGLEDEITALCGLSSPLITCPVANKNDKRACPKGVTLE